VRTAGSALLVLSVALVVPEAPIDAGPRGKAGKIVRVERPRTGARGTPRMCQLLDVHSGRCYGKGPTVGEVGWVVGSQQNYGTIRITNVEPSEPSCATPQFYTFELEAIDGSLDGAEPYGSYVLLDVDVTSNARVVEPSRVRGPDGESPWMAIDRTGSADSDNPADLIVTAFACDEQGQKYPPGQYGNGGYCMDYHTSIGSRWELARRDVVAPCR
jgi:hypothetical protein